MGVSGSKTGRTDPIHLCKERTQYIKQAIDSRYALSAAHICYIQSLRDIGAALRQFVEVEIPIEKSPASLDTERPLSPSSFASQSPPPHMAEERPLSPQIANKSYTRTSACSDATVKVSSLDTHLKEEKSLLAKVSSSWDFFDPNDQEKNDKLQNGSNFHNSPSPKFAKLINLRQLKESDVGSLIEEQLMKSYRREVIINSSSLDGKIEHSGYLLKHSNVGSDKIVNACGSAEELHGSMIEKVELQKELCAEREDVSEFITHRAKDFLSSIKDIENRYLRAAEAGIDVSKMLETRRIWLSSMPTRIAGKWPTSRFLSAFHLTCCKDGIAPRHEPLHHATEVITWNHSISSLSSSSSYKKHLALAHKDDNGDGVSDFSEEFCMISGSHSCTLERLYAWEKKLLDEVKASETIRKEYDQKCRLLRHQYARDLNVEAIDKTIDKTRAAVKDLHSQLRVSIQAVDLVSKKIEKLRDEELQPQLLEFIHGLVRMWKAMLECHHAQFITISLAYHVKSSMVATLDNESYRQALMHLHDEINYYCSSFSNWISAHKSYLQALNMWLQKCILLPQEHSKCRKVAFAPRRAPSPPIFVLCQSWLAGIKLLPSKELCDAIRSLGSELVSKEEEKLYGCQGNENKVENGGGREEKGCRHVSNLSSLQITLKRLFDQLAKLSEAAVKVFEDVRKANEMARIEYTNYGTAV